ncbi:CYP51A1 isoform 5, partial [Pan troglodytes]
MEDALFLRKSPPYIFSPIPFLGHAIAFGKS